MPEFDLEPQTKKDILAVLFFSLALISALSFLNLAGGLGVKMFEAIKFLFGWCFVLLPVMLVFWGIKLVNSEDQNAQDTKCPMGHLVSYFGSIIFILAFLGLFHIFYPADQMIEIAKTKDGGGFLGTLLAWPLQQLLGIWGGLIILAALLIISVLIISNFSLRKLLGKIKTFF